jgi:hypothetical protein
MFRVLIYIFLVWVGLIWSSLFARECNNASVITQSDFKLDISCMDPLNEGDSIKEKRDKDWNIIQTSKWWITVLTTLLWSLTDLFLFIIPIIAAISFLVAGYFYIFSAGDSEKVGRAKTIIKWNVIAIFVALFSYWIITLVASLF